MTESGSTGRGRQRDAPWVMRTYAGHSTPQDSNALYRRNLDKGQTGLSVAFDLPTQTGYDPDHELARGEVGKVGVPVSHLGDVRALFDGIPLADMNTSMTINAPAMWLLALYVTVAEEQGADRARLAGTTQNDIVKEYLSRGTYVFPPGPSLRLITDLVAYTVTTMPTWNPINICSYHLQEAGATPVQEIAYALCDGASPCSTRCRRRGRCPPERFGEVCARISFFVNAGVRFVEELCKMRAFTALWDELLLERYGVTDAAAAALPLRRAGQLASGSPRPSPRTTSSASCSRCSASRCRRTPGRARCSSRPGTRRSGCRGPGTSSGRCACSRSWPTRPTCSSTTTCSRARSSSGARSTG